MAKPDAFETLEDCEKTVDALRNQFLRVRDDLRYAEANLAAAKLRFTEASEHLDGANHIVNEVLGSED